MYTIFKKEINVFFDSLYGIIIFSIFFLINGLFIWIFPSSNIFQYGISSLEIFFDVVPYIFILFISSITMKIISEERSLGTFEILLSQPISYKEIILAKFLSCWFLSIFLIFLTFPYWITIYYLSNPLGSIDNIIILNSYIGLILLVGAMNSIGIFFSSIFQNQIISFLSSCFIFYLLYEGIDMINFYDSINLIDSFIDHFTFSYHYSNFTKGIFQISSFIYFIIVIFSFFYFSLINLRINLK